MVRQAGSQPAAHGAGESRERHLNWNVIKGEQSFKLKIKLITAPNGFIALPSTSLLRLDPSFPTAYPQGVVVPPGHSTAAS